MQSRKVIEQLGYTTKEAKVYLAVLTLGEAHISDIAETVKMPRSSVQVIVDKLYKQGLLDFYVMRRYKYWTAQNPERLLDTLKQREAMLKEELPKLISLRKTTRGKRYRNETFEGTAAIFRVIANNSPLPVLITNQDGEIEYANKAWEEQFGYALHEVKGRNPRILKSGKTDPAIYVDMWATLKKKEMFQSDDIIDRKRDGTIFNLRTIIFPLELNNHSFYVQILSDITEKRKRNSLQKKFTDADGNKREE